MLNAILDKGLRHISIVPISQITTYGQFYEACKAFPDSPWMSMLASFTKFVTGSPSPSKVQSNVPSQPNPMHLFAYVTATGHVTTIHRFLRMSIRMGQSTTQWDRQIICYRHGLDRYAGQDCGVITQLVPQSPPQPLCQLKLKRYSSTSWTTHSWTTCQLYQLDKCILGLRHFLSG